MLLRKIRVSEFNVIEFDALIEFPIVVDKLLELLEDLIATEILERRPKDLTHLKGFHGRSEVNEVASQCVPQVLKHNPDQLSSITLSTIAFTFMLFDNWLLLIYEYPIELSHPYDASQCLILPPLDNLKAQIQIS